MTEQSAGPFVRYHAGIETPAADEAASIEGIVQAMRGETDKVAHARRGLAVRASHAKPSGILKGRLTVHADLPDELRQGLFAVPRGFPALVRFAQGPGEHLSDRISTHRGMAVKLFEVPGEKLPGHVDDTQDFVLATGPVFPDADAAAFLRSIRRLEFHAAGNRRFKEAVSDGARALNATVKAVIGHGIPVLDFFGHPPLHPLAEIYYSQAPIRYGDFVAKIALAPASDAQRALENERFDANFDPDVFRHATVGYFADDDAVFDLRVQLCTDLGRMPIEDASVAWPESRSPFRSVATLTLPRQAAMAPERVAFVEQCVGFRPGHALAAHRPLGSLMRARLKAYGALAAYRQAYNRATPIEPRSLDEIPD